MPFRSIEVTLRLSTGGFIAGLGTAAAEVRSFGSDVTKIGDASNQSLERVGRGATLVGAAMVAGFGFAANAAMGFEAELSNLQAVSGATGAEMDRLRDAALEAGQATVFSAAEAAQAQSELAKAGVSTADILGGALTGALDLAAAGGLDLASAATIAAQAMNIFGLGGADVSHIADLLAAGANKSAAGVAELGDALRQGGIVAAGAGLSIEETVGTLALFADWALTGSDAGTSLKTMLLSLQGPSEISRKTMAELGLEVYDTAGNFLGLSELAGELQSKLGHLTNAQRDAAFAQIFGNDAVRAARALYSEGTAGVDEYTAAVDQQGAAAEMAAVRMDNLAGDLEQLKGSIETALIQGGSQATGVLRGLTQGATDVVNGFGAIPGPLQAVGVGLAGVGGAAVTVIGVIGTLAPKVRETKKALEDMGNIGNFFSRNMGLIAGGLGAAGAALALYSIILGQEASQQAEVRRIADEYTAAIQRQTGAVWRNVDAISAKELADNAAGRILRETGADVEVFIEAIRDSGHELTELANIEWLNISELGGWLEDAGVAGTALGDEIVRLVDAGKLGENQLLDLFASLGLLEQGFHDGTAAAKDQDFITRALGLTSETAAGGVAGLAGGLGEVASEGYNAADGIKAVNDALRAQFDPLFAVVDGLDDNYEAQLRVAEAQAALNDAVSKYGAGSAEATAASRELDRATIDVGRSALGLQSDLNTLALTMDAGGLSMKGAWKQLQIWTAEGRFTEDEAIRIAYAFAEARGEADLYGATHVEATAALDIDDADESLDDINNRLLDYAESDPRAQALLDISPAEAEGRRLTGELDGWTHARTVPITARAYVSDAELAINNVARSRYSYIYVETRTKEPVRWGGIFDAGGVRRMLHGGIESHVAPPGTRYMYAEPETGGEAFIPRLGERRRALAILGVAAGWHGADVVAARQGLARSEPAMLRPVGGMPAYAGVGGGGSAWLDVPAPNVNLTVSRELGVGEKVRLKRDVQRWVQDAIRAERRPKGT